MTDCGCTNFPANLGNVTFGAAVGIGTGAPAASLDVSGSGTTIAAYVGPTDDNQGVLLLRGGTADTSWALGHLRSTDPSPNGFALVATEGTTATPVLVASLSGLVGIGTTTPTQLLHLQGGSLYINGGNILVSGDVTTGVGAFYAVTTKVADSGGCYYGS